MARSEAAIDVELEPAGREAGQLLGGGGLLGVERGPQSTAQHVAEPVELRGELRVVGGFEVLDVAERGVRRP